MEKRWKIAEADKEKATELKQALKIHEAICRILVQRGIETFDEAKNFFRPDLKDLHEPLLMKGMKEAVERIKIAFTGNERILVFGDYDVDGITGAAIIWETLNNLGANVFPYIPHRIDEGYGLS
ncbi:MAG: single-stranded-DNA-specific exonuclease RecJ, partial [Bacteroidota bacterium]